MKLLRFVVPAGLAVALAGGFLVTPSSAVAQTPPLGVPACGIDHSEANIPSDIKMEALCRTVRYTSTIHREAAVPTGAMYYCAFHLLAETRIAPKVAINDCVSAIRSMSSAPMKEVR